MASRQSEAQRPTNAELQEREDLAFDLLSRCYHKSQIKKHFKEKYGVAARTTEGYLARARERITAQAAVGKDLLRSESFAFYSSVLRDAKATPREKILARERIDKLYGLDAPTRVEHIDREIESEMERLGLGKEAGISQEAQDDTDSRRIN